MFRSASTFHMRAVQSSEAVTTRLPSGENAACQTSAPWDKALPICGGFDYMVHKGSLVDVILGVEYQHYDVNGQNAFCGLPGCGALTSADYDLSSKGDLVRARLTIKTQGYGFLRAP